MKKTLALLLAIVISAVAICTLTISAFANPADTTEATEATTPATEATEATEPATEPATLPGIQLPDGLKPTTTVPSTAPAATEATKAPETEATKAPETSLAGTEVVTNAEGVTSIDDGPETTTKKPANVDNVIPDTGSNVVVPAVALLVLAAGTVAVVKTKKD